MAKSPREIAIAHGLTPEQLLELDRIGEEAAERAIDEIVPAGSPFRAALREFYRTRDKQKAWDAMTKAAQNG